MQHYLHAHTLPLQRAYTHTRGAGRTYELPSAMPDLYFSAMQIGFNPPVVLKFTNIFYAWGYFDPQHFKPVENGSN